MKKRKKGRKLSRTADQRKSLLRSLATELFLKEKIKTTEAKAKEFTSFAEKEITKAKSGTIAASRLLARNFSPLVVKKLTKELGPRFKERKGGYTRIVKLGFRKQDGAKMVMVQLLKD